MHPIVFAYPQAIIDSAGSLSEAVDVSARGPASALVGIVIPSAWTTANLTFQVSHSVGGTSGFQNMYDSAGTEVTVTVGGTDRFIILSPNLFAGIRYLKVRSGTAGAPVNQADSRVLKLVVREI